MFFSRVGLYLQARKAGERRPGMLLPFACAYHKYRLFVTEKGAEGYLILRGVELIIFLLGLFLAFMELSEYFAGFLFLIWFALKLSDSERDVLKGQCESFHMKKSFAVLLWLFPNLSNLYLGISGDSYTAPASLRKERQEGKKQNQEAPEKERSREAEQKAAAEPQPVAPEDFLHFDPNKSVQELMDQLDALYKDGSREGAAPLPDIPEKAETKEKETVRVK